MSDRYSVAPTVSFRQVGDEVFLLHRNESTVFNLNPTAAFIWNGIAKGESAEAVAKKLCEEYDIEPERAHDDVLELIAALLQKRMVEPV
jgi:hypothetical protein